MRLLRLIILLPIIAVLGLFLASNTQPVVWNLWPLSIDFEAPAYSVPLLALVLGLVVGALIMWLRLSLRRRRF